MKNLKIISVGIFETIKFLAIFGTNLKFQLIKRVNYLRILTEFIKVLYYNWQSIVLSKHIQTVPDAILVTNLFWLHNITGIIYLFFWYLG